MDDLIRRQDAIDLLKRYGNCDTCNNYGGVKCRSCHIDDAVGIIESVPSVEEKE
jgi:hypothetical protein